MKWLNYTLIAGAICAVVSPPHVAVCVVGATAPDLFEYVLKVGNRHIKHRGPTHVFTHWLLAALAFTLVWDYHGIGMAFAWGGVSHILTDAMTVSGVPFSPYSDRSFHLFGGRFRTGGHGFAPFFYDWGGMYQEGVIDGLEWKTNRFRLI
ncbi:metal-dependent hydrolase [Vibrio cyclitrophicus]|uniref:metal-dependent hydrolase n=1 Tax=Vibrio cyclitrophicus TaxID=47951 RepID=UPI0002E7BEA6|nr:metal-dependent hydrolase [Vibrio cyclitrophicus]OEF24158.1 hypothetical protein OA9_17075 [Vibrio cyclitrophicus 1F97]OEF76669.1 hypothetical protein OA5_19940 [Vibrio cyclitrophicus 1F111]